MVIYIDIIFQFSLYIDTFTAAFSFLEDPMKKIDEDIAKKGT